MEFLRLIGWGCASVGTPVALPARAAETRPVAAR